MYKDTFFGIHHKLFTDGTRDIITAILSDRILSKVLKHNGPNHIYHSDTLRNLRNNFEFSENYKGIFAASYNTRFDNVPEEYKIFINVFIPIVIASYTIKEKILPENYYTKLMDRRWGRSFPDNHPLYSFMFIFGCKNPSLNDSISVEEKVNTLLGNFYNPITNGDCSYSELDNGFVPFKYSLEYDFRPYFIEFIAYNSFIDICLANPEEHPYGIDINLPIFLNVYGKYIVTYRPLHIRPDVIDYVTKNNLVPYQLYVATMQDIGHEIQEAAKSYDAAL